MQSHDVTLVSNSLPIGGKWETKRNENGNGQETKGAFLCRTENGNETEQGNERRFSISLVSNRGMFSFRSFHRKGVPVAQAAWREEGKETPLYPMPPRWEEQRDNAEVELFAVTDKMKKLQARADHLRGKIARLDALPRNKNPVAPLLERISEGRKLAHLEGNGRERLPEKVW